MIPHQSRHSVAVADGKFPSFGTLAPKAGTTAFVEKRIVQFILMSRKKCGCEIATMRESKMANSSYELFELAALHLVVVLTPSHYVHRGGVDKGKLLSQCSTPVYHRPGVCIQTPIIGRDYILRMRHMWGRIDGVSILVSLPFGTWGTNVGIEEWSVIWVFFGTSGPGVGAEKWGVHIGVTLSAGNKQVQSNFNTTEPLNNESLFITDFRQLNG